MSKAKFAIGQTVYISRRRRHPTPSSPFTNWAAEPEELDTDTVTKVGRIYASLTNPSWAPARFDMDTGRPHEQDAGSMVGVWVSREAYAEAKEAAAHWDELRRFMDRNRVLPDGLRAQAIRDALALLQNGGGDDD